MSPVVLVVAASLSTVLPAATAMAGELTIDVSGAVPDGSTVYAALCQGALKEAACLPADARPGREGSVRLVAPGVAPGRYAAVVFQDVNGNGRLDRNMIGYPREPYAISNTPRGLPTFSKAAFAIDDGAARIALRLKHP